MKYKHKHASGIDKEWSWLDVGNDTSKDALEETLHELSEEYNWSEHYRGIDYELIEYPPVAIIEKEIQDLKNRIRWYQKRIKHLKSITATASVFEVQKS